MIGLPFVYIATGLLFGLYALLSVRDRRPGNAGFWGLMALSFLLGDRIGDIGNGVLALGLVAIAGAGLMRPARAMEDGVAPRGDALFVPVLIVPGSCPGDTATWLAAPELLGAARHGTHGLSVRSERNLAVCN